MLLALEEDRAPWSVAIGRWPMLLVWLWDSCPLLFTSPVLFTAAPSILNFQCIMQSCTWTLYLIIYFCSKRGLELFYTISLGVLRQVWLDFLLVVLYVRWERRFTLFRRVLIACSSGYVATNSTRAYVPEWEDKFRMASPVFFTVEGGRIGVVVGSALDDERGVLMVGDGRRRISKKEDECGDMSRTEN